MDLKTASSSRLSAELSGAALMRCVMDVGLFLLAFLDVASGAGGR
jgi:hypothetical protein